MLYTLMMAALYVAAAFLMNYEPSDGSGICCRGEWPS